MIAATAPLDGVLRRQREHLLRELRALSEAKAQDPAVVVGLLITAAELHIRADLGVLDAAEKTLGPQLRARGPTDALPAARAESAAG